MQAATTVLSAPRLFSAIRAELFEEKGGCGLPLQVRGFANDSAGKPALPHFRGEEDAPREADVGLEAADGDGDGVGGFSRVYMFFREACHAPGVV